MSAPKKISIIGSGNWGSTISIIVGRNVQLFDAFDNNVKMYVYEELIDGRKLTEIINTDRENVKYLPGHKIPPNVIAVPDVVEATKDADILIFVVPHQFVKRLLQQMQGHIKSSAIGLSLIKSMDFMMMMSLGPYLPVICSDSSGALNVSSGVERLGLLFQGVDYTDDGIKLISKVISDALNIEMSVLMGANLAPEVAAEKFCETTIGCYSKENGKLLKDLIQTNYFRVVVVEDVETVEICGALKNVVACGAGFVDGLGLGDNTKAAVIRLGLMEMIKYAEVFCKNSQLSTFFESCGVADLITTCYGGRNRKVSEAFVKSGKSIEELEKEMLNGQKLQGPETAVEVNAMLKAKGLEDKFPLFTAVYRICRGEIPPSQMVDCIRNHPEHI